MQAVVADAEVRHLVLALERDAPGARPSSGAVVSATGGQRSFVFVRCVLVIAGFLACAYKSGLAGRAWSVRQHTPCRTQQTILADYSGALATAGVVQRWQEPGGYCGVLSFDG